MSTRRRAREVAMQSVFQLDLNQSSNLRKGVSLSIQELIEAKPRRGKTTEKWDADSKLLKEFAAGRLKFPELEVFCLKLVMGVVENLPKINQLIEQGAVNWKIGRMATVDRAILRVAVFELLGCLDTPVSVIIDEAIELCKRYSSAESPAFVNGVLDRIAKSVRDTTDK